MVTPEMAQAILQERARDIAKLRLEHDARLLLRNEAAAHDASPKTSWFHVPSFVAHILRTASAH